MKTSFLILGIVLITSGLTALGYLNRKDVVTDQENTPDNQAIVVENTFINLINQQPDVDLLYKVDSRFLTTITRERLLKAKSITDILPKEATLMVELYPTTEICMLYEDKRVREPGNDAILNAAQLKLLQSTDYSSDFYVSASCQKRDPFTGTLKKDSIIYYMTVIPKHEAKYQMGTEALIEYLKSNSQKQTADITSDKLKPGQVIFTVTETGTISNVKINATSGYPKVDERLVEIITNLPGKWIPASNAKGEKVDQEFVFFFGSEGC